MSRYGLRVLFWLVAPFAAGLPGAKVRAQIVEVERPGAAPTGEPRAEDEADAARLLALRYQLEEWSESGSSSSDQGLSIEVHFLPDAVTYHAAVTYLEARRAGKTHAESIAQIASLLPRWSRYEGRSVVLVTLKNDRFRPRAADRRVYTLEENIDGEATVITTGDDGSRKPRRFRAKIAGKPAGLRLAQLRVKKFYTTADGATRRPRSPDDPDASDPASIGRRALVGKAFEALVLEDAPATLELLVDRRHAAANDSEELRVRLERWKVYEGPFSEDTLDLNEDRPWTALEPVHVRVDYPPSAMTPRPEVTGLVEAARELANTASDP